MKDHGTAIFFETPADLRAWLEEHAATETELWLGRRRGRSRADWLRYVDELLCFGWIDGTTRNFDDDRWAIRVTPRRRGSNWSASNVGRVVALLAEGRMRPAGIAAFEARDPAGAPYSYETTGIPFDEAAERRLHASEAAWRWFSAQPPSYRRTAAYWVMSAKRPETRERRLDMLIEDSAAGRLVKPFRYGRSGRSADGG